MATVPLAQWYDDVLPHVPGCPLGLALQKIRESAIEFCVLSRSWRYLDATALDLNAGQQTYVVGTGAAVGTLPAGTVLVHVFQANYDGQPLTVLTPALFKAKSDTWFDDAGAPEAFTFFNEGEISLWRIPEATEAAALELPEVALAPSQAATTIDDRMFERHREAIAIGARAKLHQLPKVPYGDVQLGIKLQAHFYEKAGLAGGRTAAGRGHSRLRTQTIYR
jgi:hypothetical protein